MSTPRTVTCPTADCRATLKLTDALAAAKKVRCPRCDREFAVPPPPASDQVLGLAAEEDRACPECKAAVDPKAVLCVGCGYDFRTGKKLKGPKKAAKKRPERDRDAPLTEDNLEQVLEEAETLVKLAHDELHRLPHVLGVRGDAELSELRQSFIPGKCANPHCHAGTTNRGLLSDGQMRVGTSKVTITAGIHRFVVELCEDCTSMCMDDIAGRDRTARGYLKEARLDLDRASRKFPKNHHVVELLAEAQKVEALARASGARSRGFCFLATAAYGSEDAAEVAALRRFRDDVLERCAAGRWFVNAYYAMSPPLASVVAWCPPLRAATRWLLWPVVALARRAAP